MIEFISIEQSSEEEARKHQQLIDQINYLIDEGFLECEQDESGEVRLYPAT